MIVVEYHPNDPSPTATGWAHAEALHAATAILLDAIENARYDNAEGLVASLQDCIETGIDTCERVGVEQLPAIRQVLEIAIKAVN